MSDKLCLLVCQNLADEVAAIAKVEGMDDVQFITYPADCSRPQSGWKVLETIIRAHEDECNWTYVLGGCCIAGSENPLAGLSHCDVHRVDLCFEMLCGRSLIRHLLAGGGHLLTPGWLAGWRHHVDAWGFDRAMAREFFGESCSRLVLLDTGVDEKCTEHLAAFADFVDRPRDIMPIGLDYFQMFLMHLILGWRSQTSAEQLAIATANTNRRISDYAMVLDLMASLTRVTTEAEVIDGILELFVMICAPASLAYIPFVDGRPGEAQSRLSIPEIDDELQKSVLSATEGYALIDSGDGFLLRIMYLDEVVGILALDGIAFSEYKDHYLNLALNVVDVCGLAVANARKYEAIGKVEESLRQQTIELQLRNEELDAFARTVAHDLENPLSLMVGFAELLENGYASMPPRELEEFLQTIARSGRKMTNIIDELLLLASVRKADMELKPLDMGLIILEARQRLADLVEERGATIILPDRWPIAWGHAPWVEEVWVNYLSNAIKYGGQPPHIVLGGEEEVDGAGLFWVSDNGPGLTLEEQAGLFVPFTQLHQARAQGHGLGLSIVQRIVEKLGGQVGVKSAGIPGQGSTFYFTLPGSDR